MFNRKERKGLRKVRKELRTISFEIDIVIVIVIDIVIDIEIDIDIVIDIEFVIDIEIVILIVIDIEFALFQFCQSEFISDSVLIEILKQVQHDNVTRGLIGVKRSNLFDFLTDLFSEIVAKIRNNFLKLKECNLLGFVLCWYISHLGSLSPLGKEFTFSLADFGVEGRD